MTFTKYNNPKRKRRRRKKDYTEKMIDTTKGMLIDKALGYNVPIETYKQTD